MATPPALASAPPASRASARRSLQKGQQTKAVIIETALGLATQIGLEGLSIGAVAEKAQMSKSGVFAHFGSREELQISVVREYFRRFEQEVFLPALKAPRGLPRVRALFNHWMQRVSIEIQSGCIFISGAVEFDDRPGPVRDALVAAFETWMAALQRAIVIARECGHLQPDMDEQQVVFEIHGFILALHYDARFLKKAGALDRAKQAFSHILERYGAPPSACPESPD